MAAGQIQSDVNSMLGTAGFLAGLSPQLQEHAENMAESRKLNKRQKVLDQQAKIAEQDLQKKFTPNAEGEIIIDPQTESELEQSRKELMRQNQEQEDISRKKYDLKPTLENYQKWQTDASINQNYRDALADIEKQKKALKKMEGKKEAKKALRRNFTDYISKVPMFGETVGSIDARHPGFAKQIASQYDRNARRRLMNQMDREARNGKQ